MNRELMRLSDTTLSGLLEADVWGTHELLLHGLQDWRNYGLLPRALDSLNTGALYRSSLHGQGHVERTLLFSTLLAWREDLPAGDTALLLLSASYHDVGRVDDGYDTEHGTRSAARLGELTGRGGEELRLMQGAVAAHSRPDRQLEPTVAEYFPADFSHAVGMARLLKDADGLDRVRIQDLNPDYLRRDSARTLAPFAQFVFDLYRSRGAAVAARWCPREKKMIFEGA